VKKATFIGAIGVVLVSAMALVSTPLSRTTENVTDPRTPNVCSLRVPVGTAHCDSIFGYDATTMRTPYVEVKTSPRITLGDGGAYSPAFLQSAYNVASLDNAGNDGEGQIVAVVDAYSNPHLSSDLAYYRRAFGLPACPTGIVSTKTFGCVLEQVNESGDVAPLPEANRSWGLEAAIDTEMISAICANCQILVVDASSAAMDDLGASVNTAVGLGANVVSNSYGAPEFADENDDAQRYFTHPGVAILAAAGDGGYGVQFPAASPSVIAVGGTTLVQTAAHGIRQGVETAWSGSGSGCSLYEPKPVWQHDSACANRTVADVGAVANPNDGVWAYDTYSATGRFVAGGTSVATAVMSAVFALADNGSWASVNPAADLYTSSSALYQVTSGANSHCGTYLCNAAQSVNGYNGPTGVGTPGGSPNSFAALNATSLSAGSGSATLASGLGAPTNVEALAGNGEAIVGWSPPLDGNVPSISSYVVADGSGNGCTEYVNQDQSDSCTVSGLSNHHSYRFLVTAINANGAGPASAPSNLVSPAAGAAVTNVATGYHFGCAVLATTTVTCWGENDVGQLGDGKTTDSSAPVRVQGLHDVVDLSLNYDTACAVVISGSVKCWGNNDHDELGTSAVSHSATPVSIPKIASARYVSVGLSSACAVLVDGSVECWGENSYGELGDGTTVSSFFPVGAEGITSAQQVAVGLNHSCAVLTDGSAVCWGANNYGELGDGATTPSSVPVLVAGLHDVATIGVGYNNTCALLTNGSVTCWGYNGEGELGNGTTATASTPTLVGGLGAASALETSAFDSCALLEVGIVQCWGFDSAGQLGQGPATDSSVPVTLTTLSGVSQVANAYMNSYSCATLDRDVVACWSSGDTAPSEIPMFAAPARK
jgi:alpha-tubulin suppressor-like RCC1 family protein